MAPFDCKHRFNLPPMMSALEKYMVFSNFLYMSAMSCGFNRSIADTKAALITPI